MPASRTRELEILNEISEALNRSADVSSALERTLELITRSLGFATGWVWLRDPHTRRFYLAAAHNLPPFLQEPVRMTGSACWCIEGLLDGDFDSQNVDSIECSRLRPAVKKRQTDLTRGLAYHASVALRFGGRDLGILNLTSKGFRKVSRDTLKLLSTIAYQIGIAIERARLAEAAADVARVQERANVARDLHDTFTQDLTAVTLQLEAALHGMNDTSSEGRRVAQALDIARDSVRRARESVERLREGPLRGQSFSGALHEAARTFTSRGGIPAHVNISAVALDPETEAQLFAIVTEALTNVRKHARAKHVTLTLKADKRFVRLVVADDGTGIEAGRAVAQSFGLRGMRERAASIGGTVTVRMTRPSGTTIAVRVPRA